MKKVLSKTSEIISWIVGYGLMIALFIGGLSFFAYLLAIIVGGEFAVNICNFIYKDFYPWLVRSTSVMIILGLIKMYLNGESSLTANKKKKIKKANTKCACENEEDDTKTETTFSAVKEGESTCSISESDSKDKCNDG